MNWLLKYAETASWVFGFSLLASLVAIIAIRYVIIYMPADYFSDCYPSCSPWPRRHPLLRWSFLVLKNLAGIALLLVGLIMIVWPGPGILTVLLGLSLLNFPGKRSIERRIVSHPAILGQINQLRARANRPALILPPTSQSTGSTTP